MNELKHIVKTPTAVFLYRESNIVLLSMLKYKIDTVYKSTAFIQTHTRHNTVISE